MGDFGPEFESAREMYDQQPRLMLIISETERMALGPDGVKGLMRLVGIFSRCVEIYVERNKNRGKGWSDFGWQDSLHHVRSKFARLRRMWGTNEVQRDSTLDDAYDLINYTGFFIMNVEDGNEDGTDNNLDW